MLIFMNEEEIEDCLKPLSSFTMQERDEAQDEQDIREEIEHERIERAMVRRF